MKIENNNINGTSFNKTESAYQVDKQHSTSQAETSSVTTKKDKAELSDQARLLSKARGALDETSDVNQQKVDDLKAKIQKGEYKPPLEGLADRMLTKFGL